MNIHAGLLAAHLGGRWLGVLIEGDSGSGKSDLALRALDHGFRLVADDRVDLWVCDGTLYGRAPTTLAGLIEVRGVGVCREPALPFCRIALAVRCAQHERMPEPAFNNYVGLSIPALSLPALECSAPAKMLRALQHLGAWTEGAYQDAHVAGAAPRPGGDSR